MPRGERQVGPDLLRGLEPPSPASMLICLFPANLALIAGVSDG